MEDWLKCQISSLVKYRQNQNQILSSLTLSYKLLLGKYISLHVTYNIHCVTTVKLVSVILGLH